MKIKYLVTISLFVFWAATTAVLLAGLVFYQKNQITNFAPIASEKTNEATLNKGNTSGAVSGENPGVSTLTSAEVAKHNSRQSCWFIISGKVYDVTNFFGHHPGGDNNLLMNCGADATIAFQTQGGRGAHSENAVNMLSQYYIGDVGGGITDNQPSDTINVSVSPLPSIKNDDDEYDDKNDD